MPTTVMMVLTGAITAIICMVTIAILTTAPGTVIMPGIVFIILIAIHPMLFMWVVIMAMLVANSVFLRR